MTTKWDKTRRNTLRWNTLQSWFEHLYWALLDLIGFCFLKQIQHCSDYLQPSDRPCIEVVTWMSSTGKSSQEKHATLGPFVSNGSYNLLLYLKMAPTRAFIKEFSKTKNVEWTLPKHRRLKTDNKEI